MRTGWVVAWATLLTGCEAGPPQDCKVAHVQGPQCLDRNAGKTERDLLLACFPFSKPERIAGAWVYGFETNEFYEGERASPEHLGRRSSNTELELEIELGLDSRPQVYQVDFVGRRSQCDMGLPAHILLVDRVIAKRKVPDG